MAGFASIEFLTGQPFYGLDPRVSENEITVRIPEGRRVPVTAIRYHDTRVAVQPEDLRPDPDFLNSFDAIDHYFRKQTRLREVLGHKVLTLITAAGEQIHIPRTESSPWDLPGTFWLLNLYAAVALLTGVAFWAYHRGRPITRILAVGGGGCYLMQVTMAIYGSREIALDGSIFLTLLHLNHLGGILFVSSLVLLLLFYPAPLPGRRHVMLIYGAALLIWLNEIGEWIEWPFSLFYFPAILLTLFSFVLFRIQWRYSHSDPAKRRMYLWLVASILAGAGLTFAVYILPILAIGSPLVSTWVANTFCLLVFLGFVLGVQFSGLFSVERWWLKACLHVLLAFAVILVDLLVISLLGMQSALGFSLAAVLCFWIYLQLRERCWASLSGRSGRRHLVREIFPVGKRPEAADTAPDYLPEKELMTSLYQPLAVNSSPVAYVRPVVLENGLKLGVTIPPKAVGNTGGDPVNLIFVGKHNGQESFNQQDAEFALRFIDHARELHRLHLAREATLLAERQRIMRDLHDEVAPDLASLVRQLEDTEWRDRAHHCLSNLRDIVYSMDDDRERSLWDAVARWRRELGDMAASAGVTIEWHDELSDDHLLSGAQWLQLSRSIRELVNNALRHANAAHIGIRLHMKCNELEIIISNDGKIESSVHWKPGKGMTSVRQRIETLLGRIEWEAGERECKATIVVPL
ncbi:MAG: hypothetical protein R3208_11085 [Ketobacteraceae bacterium]|nr:hypothetical protein [Ketobacteraceae bacterium]